MSDRAVETSGSPNRGENQWQAIVPTAPQKVTYTGTAGQSAVLSPLCSIVRLTASSDCFVFISTGNPVATSSNGHFMPSGAIEYFGVVPAANNKISVVQSSASGTLYISEGA